MQLFTWKVIAIIALTLPFAMPVGAQVSDNCYGSVDWQYNLPISNNFSEHPSGWGMAFEGGRYVTDNYAIGLFLNFHSNHEHVGRQTLPAGTHGSLTTDQQHTTFQLPFGFASRYTWNRGGAFQPYIGSKMGAEYAKLKSNFNVFETQRNTWGFYASTELGFTLYPRVYGPGLHFAAYYSYATNDGRLMNIHVDNLQNWGFRVGIGF